MSEKTCKTVRLSYGIALSAMTVITGALFIWQVLDIYLSGVSAGEVIKFTRGDVLARIARISPAFWLWIVMIAGGFVIWEVFQVKAKKTGWNDPRYALMRLKKRIPATVGEQLKESFDIVKRENKILGICWLCCSALGLIGIIYSIVYLANPAHFPADDVTHEVLNMVKNVFPWAVSVFAVACGISVYEGISAKKQLPHARKLAAGNKPAVKQHGELYNKVYGVISHKYFLLGLRVAVGCIAVSFIIAGALNGNMAGILEKAVNICMECIGLG